MSMKKPAALMAGVGTCALAVASCSSPAPAPQSDPVVDSSPSAVQSGAQSGTQSGTQSGPGSAAPPLPVGDVDNALTSRDGQSGPGAQSGPADSAGDVEATGPAVFVVVLEEGADRAATLASINKAVAAAFPDEAVVGLSDRGLACCLASGRASRPARISVARRNKTRSCTRRTYRLYSSKKGFVRYVLVLRLSRS